MNPFQTITVKGVSSLIDCADMEIFLARKWHIVTSRGLRYVTRNNPREGSHRLHEDIMRPPLGMIVDHINGNTLDNRRSNLRLCTPTQNRFNKRSKRFLGGEFKGVHYQRKHQGVSIRCQISAFRRVLYLGTYSTRVDAARAYDAAARIMFGEFACLNFPNDPAPIESIHQKYLYKVKTLEPAPK